MIITNTQTTTIFKPIINDLGLQQLTNSELHFQGIQSSQFNGNPNGALIKESLNFTNQVKKEVELEINNPDIKTLERLDKVNAKRAKEGKSPIDLQKTTDEIRRIQEDSSLSDKEKKNKIDKLRKDLGLSKGDMKALFTKRLGKIYKKAEKRLKEFRQTKEKIFKEQLKEAEKLYGKNSPEAQAIQQKLEIVKGIIEPQEQEFKQKGDFLNSLFPSSSFFGKIGGFFKKVGKGIAKGMQTITKVGQVLMKFASPILSKIPGIGQFVPLIQRGLNAANYLWNGKIKSFFKEIGQAALHVVKNPEIILNAIPGAGQVASTAISYARKAYQVVKTGVDLVKNKGNLFKTALNAGLDWGKAQLGQAWDKYGAPVANKYLGGLFDQGAA
ncbi:MAG: hypothetical protein KDK66_04795 [Deltaproteobacteria bacterium]|nr:hypothetical protein [Deltaproteobacteria bacterium]